MITVNGPSTYEPRDSINHRFDPSALISIDSPLIVLAISISFAVNELVYFFPLFLFSFLFFLLLFFCISLFFRPLSLEKKRIFSCSQIKS